MKTFQQFIREDIVNCIGGGFIAGVGATPADFPAGPRGEDGENAAEAELDIHDPGGNGADTADDILDDEEGDTNDRSFDEQDDRDIFTVSDEIVRRCRVPTRPYTEWLSILGAGQTALMLNNYALHNRSKTFVLRGKTTGITVALKHDGVSMTAN